MAIAAASLKHGMATATRAGGGTALAEFVTGRFSRIWFRGCKRPSLPLRTGVIRSDVPILGRTGEFHLCVRSILARGRRGGFCQRRWLSFTAGAASAASKPTGRSVTKVVTSEAWRLSGLPEQTGSKAYSGPRGRSTSAVHGSDFTGLWAESATHLPLSQTASSAGVSRTSGLLLYGETTGIEA